MRSPRFFGASPPRCRSSLGSTSQTLPGALSTPEPSSTAEQEADDNGQKAEMTYCLRLLKKSHLGLSELHSQFLHFFPQLPDDARVGVFVDDGMVNNVLRSVGVAQRRQGFLVVVRRRAHRCHHGCATVAPQAVLEKQYKQMKRPNGGKFKSVLELFNQKRCLPSAAKSEPSLCREQTWSCSSPFPVQLAQK